MIIRYSSLPLFDAAVTLSLDHDVPAAPRDESMRRLLEVALPRRLGRMPMTYDELFAATMEDLERQLDAGVEVAGEKIQHAHVYFDHIAEIALAYGVTKSDWELCGRDILRPGLEPLLRSVGTALAAAGLRMNLVSNSLGPLEPNMVAYSRFANAAGITLTVCATPVFGPDNRPLRRTERLALGNEYQVRAPMQKVEDLGSLKVDFRTTVAIGDSHGDLPSMYAVPRLGGSALVVDETFTERTVMSQVQFELLVTAIRRGADSYPPDVSEFFRRIRPTDADWQSWKRQESLGYAVIDTVSLVSGIDVERMGAALQHERTFPSSSPAVGLR